MSCPSVWLLPLVASRNRHEPPEGCHVEPLVVGGTQAGAAGGPGKWCLSPEKSLRCRPVPVVPRRWRVGLTCLCLKGLSFIRGVDTKCLSLTGVAGEGGQ